MLENGVVAQTFALAFLAVAAMWMRFVALAMRIVLAVKALGFCAQVFQVTLG